MKICFLHMTMGVNSRGSEISTDIIANGLSTNHQVLVMGAGNIKDSEYKYIQKFQGEASYKSAPTSMYEKMLLRLYKDEQTHQIKRFTHDCIEEISKFDPDIIVPVNGLSQIQIIKKHFSDKKIVLFGRAGIGWNDKDSIRSKPDLFISLSKKALAWASDIAHTDTQVVYIPNPIDTNHFSGSKPANLSLDSPTVLVVGAFTKYKNIDLVIKAVTHTKASLLVMGSGEEEKKLKGLADKLLPGRHLFVHVNYKDLPGYFTASDVFCFMPDSQEAFGRVYIEAMAAGLPIVAPGDSIRKSIVGDKGYYSVHDPVEISGHIQKALKVGRVDYSEELEKFSAKNVVLKIETELLALLS